MKSLELDADLKEALLAHDTLKVELLRGLKAAILNETIAARGSQVSVDPIKVVQKEIKKREQAIELYTQAGRTELADKESQEKRLLEGYLPAQLSEAELGEYIDKAISDSAATSLQDMGPVMKHLQVHIPAGSADPAVLARLVRQKLE